MSNKSIHQSINPENPLIICRVTKIRDILVSEVVGFDSIESKIELYSYITTPWNKRRNK
jgi:hypothetical protein